MLTKSAEIQNRLNELDGLIQGEASDVQKTIWENERNGLRDQLQAALSEEASQQERVEIQEAEIQAITLPYDFEELYGEEGRPVKNLNAMIIEVVKDTKRQANIEKNQALDEQKAEFNQKLYYESVQYGTLNQKYEGLLGNYEELTEENISNAALKQKAESATAQANFERDDAFSKRDAAFRQLEEANETIRLLKIKLENVPTATQSFDISPSDKLAQMVKESLDEKVARGLDRWKDIIPVQTAKIEAVTPFTGQDEAAADKAPNETDQMDADTAGENQAEQGNQSIHAMVEQTESEVITLDSLQAQVNTLKAQVKVLCDVSIVDVEEAIKAVA